MKTTVDFKSDDDEELWQQVANYFNSNEGLLSFNAVLQLRAYAVNVNIDIDLGGGFESGYETTTLTTNIKQQDFKFSLHRENFIDEIGKFFGMEDVEIGYPEFDKKLVVKTNDRERLQTLFANQTTRQFIEQLHNFTFGIVHHSIEHSIEKQTQLELIIETAIKDVATLRSVFNSFYDVLVKLDASKSSSPLY